VNAASTFAQSAVSTGGKSNARASSVVTVDGSDGSRSLRPVDASSIAGGSRDGTHRGALHAQSPS